MEVEIEQAICQSCETLRKQLEIINYEKKQLMDRLLEKPSVEPQSKLVEMSKPTNIPWNVRKQMLEAEDREKARLMRDAPKPVSVEQLEKELDIATQDRGEENAS
jgi:hypothetical protein